MAMPEPEPEGPSAGSMVAARAGLAGLGMVPGVGVLAGALDAAQLAQGADRLRAGFSARFRNQEDVQLVLAPERVLTPVLLGELSDLASRVPWIVLFFDTYERTGPFLDGWLHEVMTSDLYGSLPATVVVVTTGIVSACSHGDDVVRRWVRLVADVGEDADAEAVRTYGRALTEVFADGGVAGLLQSLLSRAR
ncbi:hypothetical protein [Streptomyces sp. NBC_01518]|uniref:hypothetical protein n=1 Tax=Streptomyces sp. NBC_01518 TaxID=2903891 RepID=UPI003870E466